MEQYPLKFSNITNFDESNYIIDESNQKAYEWLAKCPNWGGGLYSNITYILGEYASGKTHLATIWQNKNKATKINLEQIQTKKYFDQSESSRAETDTTTTQAFLIDDIDKLILSSASSNSKDIEEQLFHFLNHIINSNNLLLITSSITASKLQIKLPDLKSRINSLFAIEITKPSESMISQILLKSFSDKHITVSSQALKYLVSHIDRSYSKALESVEKLDQYSLLHQRKISIQTIKEVLQC